MTLKNTDYIILVGPFKYRILNNFISMSINQDSKILHFCLKEKI